MRPKEVQDQLDLMAKEAAEAGKETKKRSKYGLLKG